MLTLSYIIVGLFTGFFSGFLGIGGGIVLIPFLIFIYGLTQHQAQGTSLAIMIPPITLLAVIRYYYSGNVKVNIAVFVALGFILGALLGAHVAQYIESSILRKIFGIALLLVSIRMLFFT